MQSTELRTNSRISTDEAGMEMLMVFADDQEGVPEKNKAPIMTVRAGRCTWTSLLEADQILLHAASIFRSSVACSVLTETAVLASIAGFEGSLVLEKTESGRRPRWGSSVVFIVPTAPSVSFPTEALSRLIRATSKYPGLSEIQLGRYINDFTTPKPVPQFPTP